MLNGAPPQEGHVDHERGGDAPIIKTEAKVRIVKPTRKARKTEEALKKEAAAAKRDGDVLMMQAASEVNPM